MSPLEVLQKYWGFNSFRDKQEEIIEAVLAGRDTFALLPTGGGKSICYQLPAVMSEGVCFVVSPLIALMRDQVGQLKSRGISATYLYDGMAKKEIAIELENIRNNKYKLVYVSPERLQSKPFKQNLKRTQISFIAVDESHCISQWGHDFRPEFRQIATLKEDLPDLTFLALTATATAKVQQDIIEQLVLNDPALISKSFYRPNLHYRVKYDENKRAALLAYCKANKGTGIVYVRTRRRTVEISNFLKQQNVNADCYHGGLPNQTRNLKQDDWTKGVTKVMVATNAFGMGIDKSDVRFVFHYDLPDSIEGYYQEAGRAGRDGEQAECLLLYEEADIRQLRSFAHSQFPGIEQIQAVYDSLCNYLSLAYNSGRDARFDFDLSAFCEKFELKALDVFSGIKSLQKLGYIHMSEGIHRPSKLKINVSSTQLYDFQLRQPKLDGLIKTILRSYSGVYDYYTQISEHQIAQRSKRTVKSVVASIKQLEEIGIWSYSQATDKPFVTFLQPRVREIVDQDGVIETSKTRTLERIEAMVNYVELEGCRSQTMCRYFGEENPKICGKCDLCEMKSNLNKRIGFKKIEDFIVQSLAEKSLSIEQLVGLSNNTEVNVIVEVTNWLISDRKVISDKSGYLRLRK